MYYFDGAVLIFVVSFSGTSISPNALINALDLSAAPDKPSFSIA
jgi:hypothetical protein